MPVITLSGLPDGRSNEKKDEIRETIKKAVASVRNLCLTEDDVTVRMEFDGLASLDPHKQEIGVTVSNLYEGEKRTSRTISTLQGKLGRAVAKLFPLAKLIEVDEIKTVPGGRVFVIRKGK